MDTRARVHQALISLCEEVEQIVSDRIQKYGVNPKVGRNTLIGSDLEKSIEVRPTEDGLEFAIADYFQYVVLGWKRTHRYQGTFTKYLMNIRDWIRKKGIQWENMTENEMMWALAKKMFSEENHYTIPPRQFLVYDEGGDLTKMIPELNAYMDKWFDELFEAIITELNEYFK